jgi:hypothetical protein
MPAFFIDRPVFAWVIALLISLGGLLAIPFLAIAQYPIIAPPSISVSTSYPGASPENLLHQRHAADRRGAKRRQRHPQFRIDQRPARPSGDHREFRSRHQLRIGVDRGAKPH